MGQGASQLLCPFDLRIGTVDRMLNLEITDDPSYEGLELLVFDDPVHGKGMAVLLKRRPDRRFDIYRQPGLTLDPEIAQVGGELGEWLETPIDPALFHISPDGIAVDVRLTDLVGRVVQVRIDDRNGRRRHRGTLLAPSAMVEHPASLSLFVMGGCDLVAVRAVFDIRIDGRQVVTGRLPGEWLHRRRLSKYTAHPPWSSATRPTTAPSPPSTPKRPATSRSIHGWAGSRPPSAQRRAPRPLELIPALPASPSSGSGMTLKGPGGSASTATRRSSAGLDHYRHRDRIELVLDVVRGWRPTGLRR